eukprot:3038749-Amphidinium_carterae.1
MGIELFGTEPKRYKGRLLGKFVPSSRVCGAFRSPILCPQDNLNGPAGQNRVILVPRGVLVRSMERVLCLCLGCGVLSQVKQLEWKRGEVLADLNEHGQKVEVAKGRLRAQPPLQ